MNQLTKLSVFTIIFVIVAFNILTFSFCAQNIHYLFWFFGLIFSLVVGFIGLLFLGFFNHKFN